MSDLLRQSIKDQPPPQASRPRPSPINPHSIPENGDANPPSDSSSSSAASAATLRPSSQDQAAPENHWTHFFDQELYLTHETEKERARYHVYVSPPSDPKKGPLFICHHGAGASGMSFAVFAREIRRKVQGAGVLSLQARGHGSVVTSKQPGDSEGDKGDGLHDFSITTLASDALTMIQLTQQHFSWPTLPPSILIGHSLGGAIITSLASQFALGASLVGFCVIDVVEGSALEALGHMKTYLASRPDVFGSVDEATDWHTRSRTIRNPESAAVSVPSLLTPTPNGGRYTWLTNLSLTAPFWSDWFTGMSTAFLSARGAKLLVLAGTDRLDKDLMIGQMQGKFQLSVIPEAGHFVQEDVPEKLAGIVGEFWRRNDRSGLVLPMKVDEMIRQGKKV